MTWEAYSVAVRLKLVDLVTPALGLIGRGMKTLSGDAANAQRSVAELKRELQGIKQLGLVGGALAVGGVAGLSLFEAPLKAAREYELAFTKFKTLNLGDAVNKQADQFARSANLLGMSAKDLMTTMSESVGLFGSFAEAQKMAPRIAMLNRANSAIFGGKIDSLDEGATRSLLKFIDRRGGTKDDASFMRNLDLAEKLVTGSGGFIKFRDLDAFSQQGGTAFRGLSDAGILNMALLLQEQGGSRAGTSFMSLYQNLVAGRTPKKTMAMLQEFGLGHLAMETHATVGGKSLKSLVMRDIAGSALLQSNPPEWFRTVFLPALAAHGVTGEAGILKATNDLISTRTGSSQGSIMSTQLVQTLRDANLAKNAMGSNQVIDLWRKDPNSNFVDLTARWTDALRELGLNVLPMAIKGVEGLTSVLKAAIKFGQEFPNLTRGIETAGLALASLSAVGGSLMLFRAGLGAVGLLLGGSAGAGAAGGMVGALGLVSGAIGPVLIGLAALATAIAVLTPDKKDDGRAHEGEHWERNGSGRGGSWMPNERWVGRHRSSPGTLERWVPDADGRGHYETVNPVASGAASAAVVVHVHNTIDRHGLVTMVTKEQAKAASAPFTGGSDFDGRLSLHPAGVTGR